MISLAGVKIRMRLKEDSKEQWKSSKFIFILIFSVTSALMGLEYTLI